MYSFCGYKDKDFFLHQQIKYKKNAPKAYATTFDAFFSVVDNIYFFAALP